MRKVIVFAEKIILVCMTVCTAYLAIQSLFVNAVMKLDGVSEKTYFEKAIWPLSLALMVIIVVILSKMQEKIKQWDTKKMEHILICFDFVLCMAWIVIANTKEGADQAQVLYAAAQFVKGDFSKLAAEQYMGFFPYQLPLALLYEPFYILFRDVTPFVWQFINAFLICGIQYFLYLIAMKMLHEQFAKNVFVILQFCNLPIILYVSFVYGTIPGLFLVLVAAYALIMFLEIGKKVWVCISAGCIVLACLLRMNNMIPLIALCIVVFFYGIIRKKYRYLLFIPVVICLLIGMRQGVYELYEYRSGMEISKGQPFLLSIAMGLSENEERAAGWYNGYTWDVFINECVCDYELAEEFAKESLQATWKGFKECPTKAVQFFMEKVNSMWLNPDFQGLWNNEHHGQAVGLAPIVYNLYTGELYDLSVVVLGNIQFLMYLGAFMATMTLWKQFKWEEALLAIIFLGGFFFHLFWEAKAQYVIVYYIMLLPYSANGICNGVKYCGLQWHRIREKYWKKRF